ncbi:DNA glycosylase [Poronia punctata]|nr:DNA glycosylase [Poronia punctata]
MRRSLRQAQQQSSKIGDTDDNKENKPLATRNRSKPENKRRRSEPRKTRIEASESDDDDYQISDKEKPNKKRKIVQRSSNGRTKVKVQGFQHLFGLDGAAHNIAPCQLPHRVHTVSYHRPLLLDGRQGRSGLLEWFDSVSLLRSMPWRKSWIDPKAEADDPAPLRQKLERRAYEVWISEIMLQQTRVAVVIDYWKRWMGKWPTIHDLAAASPDDVMAAWRGLGYYSRATRIHEAAKLVCGDPEMEGLLPSDVDTLVAKVPGVGRYTAGAISAIVFGKPAPMVDGNVLRVLSRQLGLLGEVKTDKSVIDLLWAAADSLVKAVAGDSDGEEESKSSDELLSDRPGRWGQALMELGSTICTPKPDCKACPIQPSCRAYNEGLRRASEKGLAPKHEPTASDTSPIPDIEDACNFCKPWEDSSDAEAANVPLSSKPTPTKPRPRLLRQGTLSGFFTPAEDSKDTTDGSVPATLTDAGFDLIVNHAKKFPVKVVKKAVKEQETLVCAIRSPEGRYLIHRRPEKGLLAGLWEFPSWIVPEDHATAAKAYKCAAEEFASGLFGSPYSAELRPVGKLGSVPWLFSHLKLTMHVFLFETNRSEDELHVVLDATRRWSGKVEDESMGTGMRKCWELVREKNGD